MPAGMNWGQYLTFAASAIASMLLGASLVHNYYKPSLDVPETPTSLSNQPKPSRIISLKPRDR